VPRIAALAALATRNFTIDLIFAHQAEGGLGTLITRQECGLGLEKVDKVFGVEVLC
jgi:hypothetical protein